MKDNEKGKVKFIYGTMGAGKTSQLIKDVKAAEELGRDISVFSTIIGAVGETEPISSRDGSSYQYVWSFKEFGDILLDDVFIDECQFLTKTQVEELRDYARREKINVNCYGLLKDFQNNVFEGSEALLFLSDETIQLEHKCNCGELAQCNARYVDGKFTNCGELKALNNEQDIQYKALCEKCYAQEVVKTTPAYKECLKIYGEQKANELAIDITTNGSIGHLNANNKNIYYAFSDLSNAYSKGYISEAACKRLTELGATSELTTADLMRQTLETAKQNKLPRIYLQDNIINTKGKYIEASYNVYLMNKGVDIKTIRINEVGEVIGKKFKSSNGDKLMSADSFKYIKDMSLAEVAELKDKYKLDFFANELSKCAVAAKLKVQDKNVVSKKGHYGNKQK